MTEEQTSLARRAVACKWWKWLPGMLHGAVYATATGSGRWQHEPKLVSCYRVSDLTLRLDADRLPDLQDPATLGCLLHLVREAWGDPHSSSRWLQPAWKFLVQRPGYVSYTVVGEGYTETEALVAALEAAP